MTLQEMEKFTGLPEDELESYYSEGLIGREKEGIAVFDWQDAKDTGLIRTLKGCERPPQSCAIFSALCDRTRFYRRQNFYAGSAQGC